MTLHTSGRVNNLVQEMDDLDKAATVELPQFSALCLPKHLSLHNNEHVENLVQELQL